jgi:hypothetical protein
MLGADGGEVLPGVGQDAGGGEELVEVEAVGPAGMGGGGAEQPGLDGPADGLAEIAGHLAGEGRDRLGGNRRGDDLQFGACLLVHDTSQTIACPASGL